MVRDIGFETVEQIQLRDFGFLKLLTMKSNVLYK